MAAGRPTKYNKAMCKSVIECGKEGKSITEMAIDCGIARSKLYEYQDKYPEFRDAISQAVDYSQAWWESNGRKATFGLQEGSFNATAFVFQMCNRFHRDYKRDRSSEVDVVDSEPMNITFEVREPKSDIRITRGTKSK